MTTPSVINITILNDVLIGRVEPQIYAFSTGTIPNYLKVGDTYRPLEKRLNEWRKCFPDLEKRFAWVAKVNDETFFRDHAIHYYLENDAKRIRLLPNIITDIAYYSKEFFKDTSTQDIEDAIEDIKDSHIQNSSKYQYYQFQDSRIPITHTYNRVEDYDPRPNQQQTIEKFKEAIAKGRNNLLMYAVMRFWKSFTSMCCAVEMDANIVLIVSAKADVKGEWKKTVQSHVRFTWYNFLESNDLLASSTIITENQERGEKLVIFLTLQDLQGGEIKTKHKEIFENQIDLLLIDETHFGARAEEYGKVLQNINKIELKRESKLNDESIDDLESSIKILQAKVRIHLSGTPYRILMNSEFTEDDIIAFYQFSDIARDQEEWNEENLMKDEIKEWDNPYYGFPQMIRFAFNPNESSQKKMEQLRKNGVTYAFSEFFRPQSIIKDPSGLHKKFIHEQEIIDLLKIIDGSQNDTNILGFLDYDKIKEWNMCRHIVIVLPYRASCDALEELIKTQEFKNLNSYELINISGVESDKVYKDTQSIQAKIKKYESENKKTITFTVNRMLTGSTVPEWDTMIFLKDTSSPQEYDQAIFRLQNQYIKTYQEQESDNKDIIKFNMKPQTLLVDFNPNRMFQMQEHKSQIYNVNTDGSGNTQLAERIEKELEISPIIVLNNGKMTQITATDILKAVSEYSSNRSVLDEATSISIDYSLLDIPAIRAEIERQNKINSRQGLEVKASEWEWDELDTGDQENTSWESQNEKNLRNTPEDEVENDFRWKFAMYYARLLFFAFLTDSRIASLQEMISAIESSTDNIRIAANIWINKSILELFQKYINPFVLSELDYKIQNINTLANDTAISPIQRATNAMKKFSRLSDSEIVTPEFLVDKIIDIIPEDAFTTWSKLLDIASKQWEFIYAVYKKYWKDIANNLYSIPTSQIAYEFTRKLYTFLELDIDNIEGSYTSYDLIETNTYIENDTLKINNTPMKFDVIVGNPPYQIMDGWAWVSAKPIYHHFVNIAKSLDPKYISLIMPSRWYAGGKGLDEFRESMLNDKHIHKLVDFENSNEVFPGVDIAGWVCYYLWDRDYNWLCQMTNFYDGVSRLSTRDLSEFPILIRHERALPIIRKVRDKNENNWKLLSERVTSRKPFSLPTNYQPTKSGIPCYFTQKQGLQFANPNDVSDEYIILNKWKLLLPKAPIAGQTDFSKPVGFYTETNTRVAKPGECCTESYIVAFAWESEAAVLSFRSYLFTKIVRFLLLQTVISQDVTRKNFCFIPDLGKYSGEYTDELLRKRWNITDLEWEFINSRIR